jgi:two-component system, cell cycle sensor histidine kinase and response regulator CckA
VITTLSSLLLASDPSARLALSGNESEEEKVQELIDRAEGFEYIGELASGVVHDFNNILCVIMTYAELVGEAVTPEAIAASAGDTAHWEEVGADVSNIRLAVSRGVDLAHQLLTVAGRSADQPVRLDLHAVIGEMAGLVRRSLGEHVDVEINVGPRIWPIIMAPGQIQRVLLNLAVNAGYAMKEGGILSVSADNVVGLTPDGDHVRIRVTDTGIGMSPATLGHAFEPFFTTKPSHEGTGLGLASVSRIIEEANGTIHLDSEQGKGTTFTITFPACRALAALEHPSRCERTDRVGQLPKEGNKGRVGSTFAPARGALIKDIRRTGKGQPLASAGRKTATPLAFSQL